MPSNLKGLFSVIGKNILSPFTEQAASNIGAGAVSNSLRRNLATAFNDAGSKLRAGMFNRGVFNGISNYFKGGQLTAAGALVMNPAAGAYRRNLGIGIGAVLAANMISDSPVTTGLTAAAGIYGVLGVGRFSSLAAQSLGAGRVARGINVAKTLGAVSGGLYGLGII